MKICAMDMLCDYVTFLTDEWHGRLYNKLMEGMSFDDFLARIRDEDTRRREAIAYSDELDQRLQEALVRHRVPRIIDNDPDTQALLEYDARNEYAAHLRRLAAEYPSLFNSDDAVESFIASRIDLLIEEELLKESYRLERAKGLIASYESIYRQNANIAPTAFSDLKKRYVAELLVSDELAIDSPWIAFMNDVLPGEVFDPQQPGAEKYLIDALERYADRVEQQRRQMAVIDEAYRIAGVDLRDHVQHEIMMIRLRTVTRMIKRGMQMKARETNTRAMAQLEADFHEIARDSDLDADAVAALIAHIKQAYLR